MFDSVGLSEIMVLLLGALFIFGPDRLPGLARDASGALKRLRETVTGARGQIHEQLGPEFDHLKDVDLRTLNPKTFIRKHLLEDEPRPTIHRRSSNGASARAAAGAMAVASAGAVVSSEPNRTAGSGRRAGDVLIEPPFDAEAT